MFYVDLVTIGLPPPSRKKSHLFVARSHRLDAEMNELKTRIDLRDFVVPINNLPEPEMASMAPTRLDQFIIKNAGTKMGFLYQDQIEECFATIWKQYMSMKEQVGRIEHIEAAEVAPREPLVAEPEPRETLIAQRKQKEKTRPSHSSIFEIVAPAEEESLLEEETSGYQGPSIYSKRFCYFICQGRVSRQYKLDGILIGND
jgi:hypothetical protein